MSTVDTRNYNSNIHDNRTMSDGNNPSTSEYSSNSLTNQQTSNAPQQTSNDLQKVSQTSNELLQTSSNESAENHASDEYAVQLLGFTPKMFCDGLYNAVVDYVSDHVESTLVALQTVVGQSKLSDADVQAAAKNICASAVPDIDGAIDKLETYVAGNVFNVPNYAVLKEDQLHEKYPLTFDHYALLNEIEELKQKIAEARFVKASLMDEYAESLPAMNALSRLLELQEFAGQTLIKPAGGIVELAQSSADLLEQFSLSSRDHFTPEKALLKRQIIAADEDSPEIKEKIAKINDRLE